MTVPRNNADFHGVVITHSIDSGYVDIEAHLGGQRVGNLSLDRSGTVEDVQVDDEHQRKGIATAMWRYAHGLHARGEIPRRPSHSTNTTDEGYGWAMTTGDPVPPRDPEMLWDPSEAGLPKWQGRN